MTALLAWSSLALAALFAFALGLVLARHRDERRRLERVRHAASEIAEGNLAHRVHLPGDDDASRLAEAVNALAEAWQRSGIESRRRDEAHRQLISNLSHDLRTPITSIAGYVDAMERGIGGDPAHHLEMIAAKTGELARLTDDLFYLTKLDSGDVELDLAPLAIDEVVRQVVLGFERELHSRGVDVLVEIPETTCRASADEAALGRVVSNLVANALKHAVGMTRFGVRVASAKGACTVTVWDDGAGFGKGVEALLERGASAGPGGGSGLGLSIAHDLVRRMDGSIRARSEPGRHTEVEVSLPALGGTS